MPFFAFLRKMVLDRGKMDRTTFVRLKIHYPDGWSDFPFLIEIVYSYYHIYETWFSHNISEEDCRREEGVADLNLATSKTLYPIFGSKKLQNFIFGFKKWQGYTCRFLAKKFFLS